MYLFKLGGGRLSVIAHACHEIARPSRSCAVRTKTSSSCPMFTTFISSTLKTGTHAHGHTLCPLTRASTTNPPDSQSAYQYYCKCASGYSHMISYKDIRRQLFDGRWCPPILQQVVIRERKDLSLSLETFFESAIINCDHQKIESSNI